MREIKLSIVIPTPRIQSTILIRMDTIFKHTRAHFIILAVPPGNRLIISFLFRCQYLDHRSVNYIITVSISAQQPHIPAYYRIRHRRRQFAPAQKALLLSSTKRCSGPPPPWIYGICVNIIALHVLRETNKKMSHVPYRTIIPLDNRRRSLVCNMTTWESQETSA